MDNEQKASTDDVDALAQQKVQARDQDTSPPVYQRVVETTPLEDEPSLVALRSKRQHSKPINEILLIGTGIVLITVGTAVWVLNLAGFIKGPWSSIFGAIIASSGLVIPLIRYLHRKLADVPTNPVPVTSPLPSIQTLDLLSEDFYIPLANEQEGVLLVYTKRSCRRLNVDLCPGYDGTIPIAAQGVVKRKIGGNTCYVAVFQSLAPGNYTAHIYRRALATRITIYARQVNKIDWR